MKDGRNEGYVTLENAFKDRLRNLGISDAECNSIWVYMNDTMISAETVPNPTISRFTLEKVDPPTSSTSIGYEYLYQPSRDQSRQVDFGVYMRNNADLYLSKDLYKTTLILNGKKEEYKYNKKTETDSEGNWIINLQKGTYEFNGRDVQNRASDVDYNGGQIYERTVRKSEYLYDGSDAGTTDAKNLQVYVTYKITLKNQSQSIYSSIEEVVDYYDSDQFMYDPNNKTIQDNTYIGNKSGVRSYDLTVDTEKSIYSSHYNNNMNQYYQNSYNINGQKSYKAIYLTNIRSITQSPNTDILRPGELTYLYITFKVINDPTTNRVKIDQDVDKLNNGIVDELVGKRNIAEINGYKTYAYSKETGRIEETGVIDVDSNAGSLKPRDLDDKGNIISSTNSWENRLEDDTDKAGNLKLLIDPNEPVRRMNGYVFEDARTEISNNAIIGNGVFNANDRDKQGNSDKKINGVTVELVELVPFIDEERNINRNL